jgi:hypothetical protein
MNPSERREAVLREKGLGILFTVSFETGSSSGAPQTHVGRSIMLTVISKLALVIRAKT